MTLLTAHNRRTPPDHEETPMAAHSSGRNRPPRTRGTTQTLPALVTADTEVAAMQPPNQPPVIIATDETLARFWASRDDALAKAQESGVAADSYEKRAAATRTEAAEKRQGIARLQEQAAKLEADAGRDDRDAKFHRQEEEHGRTVGAEIAATVDFLRATNSRVHPAELQQRAEQQAAALAIAQTPLTAPLGELVSASPDPAPTASFSPVPAEAS